MPSTKLVPINGIIQNIAPFGSDCCQQLVSILNSGGVNNFIVGADTYVVGEVRLRPGMRVTAFYDATLPVPLIFPPQYHAVIISRRNPPENIFAGYFDESLTAEEDTLKLNISSSTQVVTANGQRYACSPGNHMLVVYYSVTTRSIPPLTTPRRVIVLC